MPTPKKYATDAERKAAARESARQRRANETPEQKRARLEKQWLRQQRYCAGETEDHRTVRRDTDATSHRARREAQTEEQRMERAQMETLSQRTRRQAETEAQWTERRETDAASHKARRKSQTEDKCTERAWVEAASQKVRRETQTVIVAVNLQQEYQIFLNDETTVQEHNCGPMDVRCNFCGSRNFIAEKPSDNKFTKCCQKGKVHLPEPLPDHQYPVLLQDLMQDRYIYSKNFMIHI